MAVDLNGTAIESFWTGTSFLLTSTIFLLPLGAVSHIFGRLPTLTFAILCFTIGIIISGVARNSIVMLVGRTMQGIGGGGIVLLNDIIITDLVPMRLRGLYSGIIGGIWALGSVTGPVIGGVLAYKASWVSYLVLRSRAQEDCLRLSLQPSSCIVGGLCGNYFSSY
jgi:MFS family permease